jgi:hypothetical protein
MRLTDSQNRLAVHLWSALNVDAIHQKRNSARICWPGVDALKGVSFQEDKATFENGAMRLTGNVRITVDGHVMASDVAMISADRIVLEGQAHVDQ